LHTSLTGGSEKITKSIAANEGLIAWLGDTPSTEACSPGVSSNVYVTDYDTGLSRITVNNVLQAYFSSTVEITGIQFFKDENGKIRLGSTKATASSGPMDPIEGQFGRAAGAPVRVNWREIQQ